MRSAAACLFALLSASVSLPALAQTLSIDTLQLDLQASVCRNDWDGAIDLTNQLIGCIRTEGGG